MMHPGRLLRILLEAAVARAQPAQVLPAHLPPPPRGRTVVLGAGKASAAMARTLQRHWPADRPLSGVVVTRRGHIPPQIPPQTGDAPPDRITLLEAGHPVPDAAGRDATQQMLAALQGLGPDDLVIALMSGGGSALLASPLPGWTLAGEQDLNRQLLTCGASIAEMNTVRRHLSALKGGRLARHCRPARLVTLAISDVPGDALSDIASGPTVPDATTCADALALIERYRISLPDELRRRLQQGELETPKPGDPRFAQDVARVIATPQDMLQAAAQVARQHGLAAHVLSDRLEGEARDVGTVLAGLALQAAHRQEPFLPPCVLLSGGETTVTLDRTLSAGARGGRNRTCLLSAALTLRGDPAVWMLAADTDGIDGSSDAAGALIQPDTLERAQALGLDARALLARHESALFFEALGDQIVTGPTFTNVNDFRAVLILPTHRVTGVQ